MFTIQEEEEKEEEEEEIKNKQTNIIVTIFRIVVIVIIVSISVTVLVGWLVFLVCVTMMLVSPSSVRVVVKVNKEVSHSLPY